MFDTMFAADIPLAHTPSLGIPRRARSDWGRCMGDAPVWLGPITRSQSAQPIAAARGRRCCRHRPAWRLVLVRRDNVEHLLLINGPTALVVESNIVYATHDARRAGSAFAQRSSAFAPCPPAARQRIETVIPAGAGSDATS